MLKKTYLVLGIITILLCGISAKIGYSLYEPINAEELEIKKAQMLENKASLEKNLENSKNVQVSSTQIAKVNPYTKMTYEYFYSADNITEVVEDVPPYFLIDLTREDMEKEFDDWTVKSFSEKEVVLQKVIEGKSSQHYIIGNYEGNVAVFYEKDNERAELREITNKPVVSLPEEEQENINNGIKVVGEDKLIEYLEDFES